MLIEQRRALRLALGLGLTSAIAYGAGWPLPYLVVLLAITLLAAPGPAPGPRAVLLLLIVLGLACLWGITLGTVLTYTPALGLLLALLGIAAASVLGARPALKVPATLFLLANTIIAVIAQQSSAAGLAIAQLIGLAVLVVVPTAHLLQALLPDDGAATAPPGEAAAPRSVRAVRSALVILPPLVAALSDPGRYIMVLMKGAQLAEEADRTARRLLAGEMIGSTLIGCVAAMAMWRTMGLAPGLPLLVLLMTALGLVAGMRLTGATASRFTPAFWQNVMVTAVVLFGGAVTDSGGDDIERKLLLRMGMFVALAVYATVAAQLLDTLWPKRIGAAAAR